MVAIYGDLYEPVHPPSLDFVSFVNLNSFSRLSNVASPHALSSTRSLCSPPLPTGAECGKGWLKQLEKTVHFNQSELKKKKGRQLQAREKQE